MEQNNKKEIKIFAPLRYKKINFAIQELNDKIGKQYQYASKGRYAIIHILRSLGIFYGMILISSYICPTVQETLTNCGYDVDYYDIDP